MSEHARSILERMEPDRRYEPEDLRPLVPGLGSDGFRETMHELWVGRHVERAGHSGWRRHRSMSPHAAAPARGESKSVKPEDLFDHTTFADFFK